MKKKYLETLVVINFVMLLTILVLTIYRTVKEEEVINNFTNFEKKKFNKSKKNANKIKLTIIFIFYINKYYVSI